LKMTNDAHNIKIARMTKIVWLLVCWGLLLAPCAMAQPRPLVPTYWKQRMFFIPYQVNQRGKLLDTIAKVQLLSSRTGANDWATLEEAEPNVQGFSYHAPEDGEYWFALRHLDRRGQPWPSAAVQPQMRLVVDTVQPELTLEGSHDATGEVVIRYEAQDANLKPDSLVVEVQGTDNRWSPLRLGTPDVAQPDRLVGRVRWRPPTGTEGILIRASIADHAGQHAQAKTEIPAVSRQYSVPSTQPSLRNQPSLRGPILNSPTLNRPSSANTITNPFLRTAELPSHDWPANNRLPRPATLPQQAPPSSNPYTAADQAWPQRTPAQLVGDAATPEPTMSAYPTQSLNITPLEPDSAAPSLIENTPWPSATRPSVTTAPSTAAKAKSAQDQWTPARPAADGASRVVNSRTFDVEYDLQSVGPWGVSKVELWGTHDNGRIWQSYGVDPDNRSPIRVTVPAAGTFGFRILVDGANSAGALPPRLGDEPELTVAVDLQPPTAELLSAKVGQGNQSDHLLVRWTATDTNLEPRPISLFYSSYPNGPWSTIASGLENTGSYTWRIERHVPGRFYLRLEARDTAGNLATFQTPSPIELARPQPTGQLRGVRPVARGSASSLSAPSTR